MALGINIIDSIKSALRTAADVGDKYNNFNTKSVARGADEQSFLLPVLVDDTNAVDLATTETRNLDLVYASDDPGRDHLIERIESRNGVHTIEAAAALGCGSREYELQEIQ